MLTTGLDGGRIITSAPAMASSTPGAGDASAAPANTKPAAGTVRAQSAPTIPGSASLPRPRARPPRAAPALVAAARHGSPPGRPTSAAAAPPAASAAEHRGGRRQRAARPPASGSGEVGRDVHVAQAEPAGPGAVGGKLGQDGEGLAGPAPALLLVDAAAEGVHDGVQVGAHVQAEQHDVVAGVADDGDLGVRDCRFQPAQEPGGPDSAREHGDAHAGKSGNRAGPVPPHPRKTAQSTVSRAGKSQVSGPDLPVIRGKPESISRIPLDAMQDTRV